jgi:integrase
VLNAAEPDNTVPKTNRAAALENRTKRARITRRTRVAVAVGDGLALLYRRGAGGIGTWQVRRWNGKRYTFAALGEADDMRAADGAGILDYWQAFEQARKWAQNEADRVGEDRAKPATMVTVADALDAYFADYVRRGGKAPDPTRHMIERSIRPQIGHLRLAQLKPAHIRKWLQALAASGRAVRPRKGKAPRRHAAPTEPDAIRARQATVNRIFNQLRAALNYVYRDGLIASDTAWRQVRSFQKVDEPRIRFLTATEAAKLVNHCPLELRRLVRAALLTGARFGELARLRVGDLNSDIGQLYIAPGKSGRPRHLPLNTEGLRFFRDLVRNRATSDFMLTRDGGQPWHDKGYRRMLQAACHDASITPAITLHELRHTFASLLAQAGCDLLTISKLLGHADTRVTSRHYAHLCDATLANAVARLPEFAKDRVVRMRAIK